MLIKKTNNELILHQIKIKIKIMNDNEYLFKKVWMNIFYKILHESMNIFFIKLMAE